MREQKRARKFGTCSMNFSLYRLYFLVFPSHRCDVLYLPTSTSTTRTATNMSRFFARYIIISARVQYPTYTVYSLNFVHGFIYSKYRRSFITDYSNLCRLSFKLNCLIGENKIKFAQDFLLA